MVSLAVRFTVSLITLFVSISGCQPKILEPIRDELGCLRPVDLVGVKEIDIQGFVDLAPALLKPGLNISISGAVYDGIGKVARGSLADEYIICRAQVKGYVKTKTEMDYLRSKLLFIRTQPSAEQFIAWDKEHPPPQPRLTVVPTNISFLGNPASKIDLINNGDAQANYWFEQFPACPRGPFYVKALSGKLEGTGSTEVEIVIAVCKGITIQSEYNFVIKSNAITGEVIKITISVFPDRYL